MVDRPRTKPEWAMLWAMFILPAVTGCIVWIEQREPVELAYVAWTFAAAFAVILMIAYHSEAPSDEDDE